MVDQIHGEYQFMRSNGFARRAGLRARSTEKAGRDSSADRAQFGAELNSYRFIAKADITATVIIDLANTREQAVPNPDTAAKHSQPRR